MSAIDYPKLDIKTVRRMAMLEGRCPVPEQIVALVGHEYRRDIEAFFGALWFNYLKNKGTTSLVYWSDRFNNEKVFNKLLIHLSRAGWINTVVSPARNWAEVGMNEEKLLQYLTEQELQQVRVHKKFVHYILEEKDSTTQSNTKLGRKILDTGLRRPGFMKASNTRFSYDVEAIEDNYDVILANLCKSMEKIRDDMRSKGKEMHLDLADYDEVSKQILEHHLYDDREYTTGDNTNDSRGRAIKEALGKVFNPISSKDARACIIIPERFRNKFTALHLPAVYLAIAELLGVKKSNKRAKLEAGLQAYHNRTLHDLDETLEEDRKDWYENIWLSRLYKELDKFYIAQQAGITFYWSVPIEIDATASMIMLTGTLLGDKNYLTLTNAYGDQLNDFWTVPGIRRQVFKKVGTPTGYGSSRTPKELLDNNHIKYSLEELRLVTQEVDNGRLALMNTFKNFIINNVQPKEQMRPVIDGEEFTILCNRYSAVGDKHVDYTLYDSGADEIRQITHTKTHFVPNLQAFKRYFVTLLIHNLDSQIADKICQELDWVIDIHDAFIVCPTKVQATKAHFGRLLEDIFNRKDEILAKYFESIGIPVDVIAVEWQKVRKFVDPIEEWDYNDMALK